MEWTDEEWAAIVVEHSLPEDTAKPELLQTEIEVDQWSSGATLDLAERPLAEQLRKFVLVDGNHRIWILQSIKVHVRERERGEREREETERDRDRERETERQKRGEWVGWKGGCSMSHCDVLF